MLPKLLRTRLFAIPLLTIGAFGTFAITPALAQSAAATELANCLADNTSGKERKELAKWVFAGMSVHPEIVALSRVGDADREKLDRGLAALFTRLVTQDCLTPARAATQSGQGPELMKSAFEHLGRLAMQELVTNPAVNQAMGSFVRHLDQKQLETALSSR